MRKEKKRKRGHDDDDDDDGPSDFLCVDVGGWFESINCITHVNFTAENKKS